MSRAGIQENTQENTLERPRERSQEKLARPSFYVVVVHNDPITPRGFVVEILRKYFAKPEPEAKRIMLLAHNHGIGVVERYTREIAESKAKQVNEHARASGYPLYFSVEEA